MLQACVVYQLMRSGRVVYRAPVKGNLVQNGGGNYTGYQTCNSKCLLAQEHFQRLLRDQFGQEGLAMCCQIDNCNKAVDPGFAKIYVNGGWR